MFLKVRFKIKFAFFTFIRIIYDVKCSKWAISKAIFHQEHFPPAKTSNQSHSFMKFFHTEKSWSVSIKRTKKLLSMFADNLLEDFRRKQSEDDVLRSSVDNRLDVNHKSAHSEDFFCHFIFFTFHSFGLAFIKPPPPPPFLAMRNVFFVFFFIFISSPTLPHFSATALTWKNESANEGERDRQKGAKSRRKGTEIR